MNTQIIITELKDTYYQWVVLNAEEEIVGFGFAENRFYAFKEACAFWDRNKNK